MKIWCLFSIENDYNQPRNCLEHWWKEKPEFEAVAQAIGIQFKGDDNILNVVNISQGEQRRIGNTDYWLQEVPEGAVK